jgi:uncharacterized protein YbcI
MPDAPDASEMVLEHHRDHHGQVLAELSNAIVGHMKDFTGRGPTKCRSYWRHDDDVVFVLLRGGQTEMERSLHAAGSSESGTGRRALLAVLEPLLRETAERVTGRRVSVVIVGSSDDQDVSVMTFLLGPQTPLS